MATFQISRTSGQYWYHLRADNGEIVQSGEGYTSRASCENGIQSVKANCQPRRFESFFNAGQYGFNHVASNGEIIGRSEKYTTAQARDHGLQVVIREAPEARVQDLS
ncbi:YegP family protein [Hymenobacter armeniacus]|uniref:YegP family protein n=1 Tax=Hymenobacter armeniacus TaxID=2771358 RepID=A0ABR8JRK4_9BACT|nr:YegP family protein [Hymenobacter armeniacus]MBD2722599.1 YegP family protein [Hymenobacter armeniacus]